MNHIAKGSQEQTIKQLQTDFTEQESNKDTGKAVEFKNTLR